MITVGLARSATRWTILILVAYFCIPSILKFANLAATMLSSLFFTTVASIFGLVLGQSIYSSDNATFTNPILQKYGADPWVVRNGDDYLMTYTTNDNITILRSRTLTSVAPYTICPPG